jgi:sugar lactone lactonase YvrE
MPFFGSLGILITRALVVAAAVLNAVTTLVGNGSSGFQDYSGLFFSPEGIAIDSSLNLYIADTSNHCIRKVEPSGAITLIAGNGGFAASGDGTKTSAFFNNPRGITIDSTRNLYVTESGNHTIRKITPEGVVTTIAGRATFSGNTNGSGTNATFNVPRGIAVDSGGNLYVADSGNHRIRKITPTGVVSTFAGGLGGYQDGTGTTARFNAPFGIAVNSAGTVYVLDTSNNRIRTITPTGVVATFAGQTTAGSLDGAGTNARFNVPRGLALDSSNGKLYVANGDSIIRTINISTALVGTFAGSSSGHADGTGTTARFNAPFGLTVDTIGNVYIADTSNHRIRKITPDAVVTTLAGNITNGFQDSVELIKVTNNGGIAVDTVGNVYVVEYGGHCIRKFTPDGITVSLFAGSGSVAYGDGTGAGASFNYPRGAAIDSAGNLYVADNNNPRIRKITPAGVVTTIAGNGTISYGDGPGLANAFKNGVFGIAVDSVGSVYVADYNSFCIRKITGSGVTTFAGLGETSGFADGTGTDARFNRPGGLAFDSSGNLYVADSSNHRIRKISSSRVVTTIAGNGTATSVDGTGTNATFNEPLGIAIDGVGNLYVSEGAGQKIRKITPDGVVSTFAGSGIAGATNGTGTNASFQYPITLAFDAVGNLYVGDYGNVVIRKITPAGVVTTFAGQFGETGLTNGGIFKGPFGIVSDLSGTVYIADTDNHRIVKTEANSSIIKSFAGFPSVGSTNATGILARFNSPYGVTINNSSGIVYVAESYRIRAITSAGVVTTLAGSGSAGSGDGTGAGASFNIPVGITVDSSNFVYVCEIGNHLIRRITADAIVTTIAGGYTPGFADGKGNAYFNTPSGIVADIYGNLYVADTNNHCIRRVTSDSTVTTLAGQTTPGYADGIGTNAQFNFPYHISIDALGTLYVADQTNHRIRTIQTSTGVVATLAGDGTAGFTTSRFNSPRGITVDRFRNAYVGDTGNHSIRKIAGAFTLPENNGVVTTVAGFIATFLDGNGIAARFNGPLHMTVDLNGNLYVADAGNNRIRKITPRGVVTTIAGNGTAASGNGTGTNATFNYPWGITIDPSGNLYVTENIGNSIRRITPGGVVTTFAGSTTAGATNGTGTSASFTSPRGIAIDVAGNLYVADGGNHRIRKITPSAVVTTLAGSPYGFSGSADGTGTNATFTTPTGITVDSESNVYTTQTTHFVRKITPAGVVTTLAGFGNGFSIDGTGTNAGFLVPAGITVDSNGNLFVAEGGGRIRRIRLSDLVVTTLAGNGTSTSFDGTGTNATFNSPNGIIIDSSGTIYVTEANGHRIRKIGSGAVQLPLNRGVVTTFAGSGTVGSTDGTGTGASFFNPSGVAVDSVGTVYITDSGNNRIRRITTAGVVTTFAGSTLGTTDATGTNARFNNPYGVAVDSSRTLYITDAGSHRIRKITPFGVVSTFAGSTLGTTDATGTNAQFNSPVGITVDSSGTLYVSENNRIRKITPAGVVTTLAGKTTSGYLDGTGTNATFSFLNAIAIDSAGNLYGTDGLNNRIRKITPAGVVTTFAGNGTASSVDGTGTNAQFNNPYGMTIDSSGTLYVTETESHRIRKITSGGVVTTLAGTGGFGTANGTGTNAAFYTPIGIAVDSGGILYLAEHGMDRIRKIQ